jgi:hypothetical protein
VGQSICVPRFDTELYCMQQEHLKKQFENKNKNKQNSHSLGVNTCQHMSKHVNTCQHMSTNVNTCQHMSTRVNICQHMSTHVNTCLYGHTNQTKDSQLLKKSSVTLYLLYGKILLKAQYSFLYLHPQTQVVSEIGGHIWPMDQNKDRTSYNNMW